MVATRVITHCQSLILVERFSLNQKEGKLRGFTYRPVGLMKRGRTVQEFYDLLDEFKIKAGAYQINITSIISKPPGSNFVFEYSPDGICMDKIEGHFWYNLFRSVRNQQELVNLLPHIQRLRVVMMPYLLKDPGDNPRFLAFAGEPELIIPEQKFKEFLIETPCKIDGQWGDTRRRLRCPYCGRCCPVPRKFTVTEGEFAPRPGRIACSKRKRGEEDWW